MKQLFQALAISFLANPASAQEIILGLGYSDFSLGSASDATVVEIEYHHKPFHHIGRLSFEWGAVLSTDTEGNNFIGAGLVNKYAVTDAWFVELSLMPGAYFEGSSLNDLGNTLEFRSVLGLGYRWNEKSAMSLAFQHKSNAGISTTNPGVNSVLVRYHRSF
ncbi:acyloxyacyl hydrolase [Shimia sp.]|uniref:acyloxyacyl hydrolase n=1 Tax=Shimia sp. TaxID=1954381 RepID=UPI0032974F7D